MIGTGEDTVNGCGSPAVISRRKLSGRSAAGHDNELMALTFRATMRGPFALGATDPEEGRTLCSRLYEGTDRTGKIIGAGVLTLGVKDLITLSARSKR
jgi:hypothetical protein